MNFTFDVVDNTDVFKASIVTRPLLTDRTPTFGSIPKLESDRAVVENLNDPDAALALLFPTIQIPAMGDQDSKNLHILRGLGQGIMGRVFLARDASTSQVSALKVFSKRDVVESEELDNTIAERCCLAQTLENPFTVELQASFQDETRLYMLLDFCAGGDLATELLRSAGNLPMDTAVYNAAHLIEGLASLHASGIIHRDLKPENILLTAHGHVKISDFGSAIRVTSADQWIEPTEMDHFGTPAYLAPEVMAGDSYNCKADWWSLGVIIYEMLLGEHPFMPALETDEEEPTVDLEDMQESIYNGEYSLPDTLDSATRRVIRVFLRTDPERRYSAARARKLEFFEGWDWDLVRTLQYRAPKPGAIHADDAGSNFDPAFTTMSLDVGEDDDSTAYSDPQLFAGFKSVHSNIPTTCPKITDSPACTPDTEEPPLHNPISQLSAYFAEELTITPTSPSGGTTAS